MHKIFATRHWFPEWIDDWSQLGTEKCQHSSTSTILCFAPSRYQWLGLICHSGFRCSCKERHEESFLAKRAWTHLYSWDKLKVSRTFRNRRTCLSIHLSPWGSWHFIDGPLTTATCRRTGPPFYKCNCISQEWPDKQTHCQETIYTCSLFCINATCTLGQNHHLLRPQPLKRETRQVAYSVLGPAHALNPGLPHRYLWPACWAPLWACWVLLCPAGRFDHAESYLPGRTLSSYARGHGQRLSMWAGGKQSLEATISRK